MEKALLVIVKLKSKEARSALEEDARELEELARACHLEVVDHLTCIYDRPTANLLIGKGKAEEIALLAQEEEVDAIVFSQDLSGTQQRNLERIIDKKTIDRTQLILDIFARRAKSPEGKMQVELAQLQYLLPRLIGKGIILSRLGGGIGTRGPGEQKLEVDRRRIRERIDSLKQDLIALGSHRQTMRKKRKERSIPSVALVGYTSAGKSTLLNTLTGSQQVVSDSLFTTLDPVYRGVQLPNGEQVVLSDTVGFLNDLPHHLVEAFKATLEDVVEADLLIHVLDVAKQGVYQRNKAVQEVLKELGADAKPMISALNKTDLLDDAMWVEQLKDDFVNPVLISAKFNNNIDLLLKKIQESFSSRMAELKIMVPHTRMDLVDLFYREGKVKEIDYEQEGIKIRLNLPVILANKLFNSKEIKEIS